MAMMLFGYIFCSGILPLKIKRKYKIIFGMIIFIIAQKNGILRWLGGGLFFSPELPRWLLVGVAFLYGILFFTAFFLLFRDILVIWWWQLFKLKQKISYRFPFGYFMIFTICISVLLSGYSLWEGLMLPKIKYVEIYFDDLPPEFDGFSIAVLADIHASALNQAPFINNIVEETMAAKPDLIVLPGDIIDGRVDKRIEDVEPLRKLYAPYGVYAVNGNHEYYSGFDEWMTKFEELRLPVLINSNVPIAKDGAVIYLGGIADYAAARRGQEPPDMEKTWRDVPADGFKILLSHQPKNNLANARSGVRLQISGHTHGGMIIGMDKLLIAPSNGGVVRGTYDFEGMKLYISSGAAIWSGFPLRIGIPPEITMIVLKRK